MSQAEHFQTFAFKGIKGADNLASKTAMHVPRSLLFRSRGLDSQELTNPTIEAENHFTGFVSFVELPPLPEIYHLPRNAVRVPYAELDAKELSKRIAAFIQVNSINVIYESQIGRLMCSSSTVPKFTIQLWRIKNGSSIVIEVQRRIGCSVALHYTRKSFFHAIQGQKDFRVKSPFHSLPHFIPKN